MVIYTYYGTSFPLCWTCLPSSNFSLFLNSQPYLCISLNNSGFQPPKNLRTLSGALWSTRQTQSLADASPFHGSRPLIRHCYLQLCTPLAKPWSRHWILWGLWVCGKTVNMVTRGWPFNFITRLLRHLDRKPIEKMRENNCSCRQLVKFGVIVRLSGGQSFCHGGGR